MSVETCGKCGGLGWNCHMKLKGKMPAFSSVRTSFASWGSPVRSWSPPLDIRHHKLRNHWIIPQYMPLNRGFPPPSECTLFTGFSRLLERFSGNFWKVPSREIQPTAGAPPSQFHPLPGPHSLTFDKSSSLRGSGNSVSSIPQTRVRGRPPWPLSRVG